MLRDVKRGKIRLAALSEGNKESIFAMYVAATFGWDIACMITIPQEKSDTTALMQYQAQAMALPLIIEQSSGEKIGDYYEAIKKAKEQYQITGIIVSKDYEIISKVCKELQVRIFAPLWQKNQMQILKEMIEIGMEICIDSIKTRILSEKWLGRKLDISAYEELMQLHHRIGFNPAGSAGEYSSVVLYCPLLFQKKIEITKAEKIMESEGAGTYAMTGIALV